MSRRHPVRYLAPLALLAFVVALAFTIGASRGNSGGESVAEEVRSTAQGRSGADGKKATTRKSSAKRQRKFYVVKPGDTPSAIAERQGVTLEDIERLNPDIDPQTLSPGQRVRLRQ